MSTPVWRTRAADTAKPDYRPAAPQNTAGNTRTPPSGREITGELETKHK